MNDLFGNPVSEEQLPTAPGVGARKATQAKGYVARPGSGPTGETCGTCCHLARISRGRVYLKCALARAAWTHGPGSDIRAKSPACRLWQPKERAA